jgi:DNA-binding GntR family transcriptional regulator
MIERLMARVGPYVYTYAIAAQDNSRVLKHHGNMFQGLAERNKKMITEALREDLETAAHIIIPALEQKSKKEKN